MKDSVVLKPLLAFLSFTQRGERARFQLFGDSMNTASRIETTGRTGRIHISQQTADLLKAAGKESWYIPRKDKVHAKGKGELQVS
jgi:class 3 adenylate cyclase